MHCVRTIKMYRNRTILLLAIILLTISSVSCRRGSYPWCQPKWWKYCDFYNTPAAPKEIQKRCNSFDLIVNDYSNLIGFCQQYRDGYKLLLSVSYGIAQALDQCRNLFEYRPWNCTVPVSTKHCLGRFAEKGTPETAFVNAIISARITWEVARRCRNQELESCTCDFSVEDKITTNANTIGSCGDNHEFGTLIAKQFTDGSSANANDSVNLVTTHNNKVGRVLVENTITCICHGMSATCTIQTCYKKLPDVKQLGAILLQKYDDAKHVKVENGELKPVEKTTSPLKKCDLIYLKPSPNFCKQDLSNGIFGTSGRRCYPDSNDHTNCKNLCCDGEVVEKEVIVKQDRKKCCKFIWCCYLDCSSCATYTETQYFCK